MNGKKTLDGKLFNDWVNECVKKRKGKQDQR